MSGILVQATVGNTARYLPDWLSDAIAIEGFGAKGDGVTDDSAAFQSALASGYPVRFGPKTYTINGPFTISGNATLLGVRGETIIRRGSQTTGSAWFTIGESGSTMSLAAQGIIFDSNTSVTSFDYPSILVTNQCVSSYWSQCQFVNNRGGTSGSGLVIASVAATGNLTKHIVIDCEAFNNQQSGIYGQAFDGLQVQSCRCYQNGACGIKSDFFDSTKTIQGRYTQITGNRCWGNQVGISVGDFTQQNNQPGPANPDTTLCLIQGNTCSANTEYGIVAQGQYLMTCDNVCASNGSATIGAGILANSSNSVIRNNMVVSNVGFGIDAGSAAAIDIDGNYVSGSATGINIGGSQNCRVSNNFLDNISGWSIQIFNIETTASNVPFPAPVSNLLVSNNNISIAAGTSFGGIIIFDGAQGVIIRDNNFCQPVTGGTVTGARAILASTDQYTLMGNLLNGERYPIISNAPSVWNGLQTVLFADVLDGIIVPSSSSPIQSILSANNRNYAAYVTFLKVTNGGSGYTSPPTVTISGGGGSGATATAYISGGSVIGFRRQSLGTGYTSAPTVTLTGGGGSGATASAFIGLSPPTNRTLRIICETAITFAESGSNPPQVNWTGSPITVQAGTDIEWRCTNGQWVALRF